MSLSFKQAGTAGAGRVGNSLTYNATPTGSAFHNSQSPERWVIGPVGAGKTVMACMEMYRRMVTQAPHPKDNVRYTRGLVIRESFPQLKTTTIKTWMEWFGQAGTLSGQSPVLWSCRKKLPDGTYIDAEVWFYALSDGFDASKLRSLEVTYVYISEFAEIQREILDVAATRLRYPKTYTQAVDGYDYGPTWRGIFGESNAPPVNSHWYERLEVDRPQGCEVFKQPPPLLRTYDANNDVTYVDNPTAENIASLPGGFGYYHDMIRSMSDEAIDVLILNQYGKDVSGKPVFPTFRRDKTVFETNIEPNLNYPILIGMDFGLQPAAVLGQMTPTGALMVLDEVTASDILFEDFINDRLVPMLRQKRYARCKFEVIGDPAGVSKNAMSKLNPFETLRKAGLAARPAKTNVIKTRIAAVEHFLAKDGHLLMSNRCSKLVEAMDGGYRYKKIKGAGSKQYSPDPDKNDYSHVADALQYLALEYRHALDLREQRNSRRQNHKPISLAGRQFG